MIIFFQINHAKSPLQYHLSKIVSVLLSASVKRFFVSRMRDFFYYKKLNNKYHECRNPAVASIFKEYWFLERIHFGQMWPGFDINTKLGEKEFIMRIGVTQDSQCSCNYVRRTFADSVNAKLESSYSAIQKILPLFVC